jgi:hypothetical protein
MLINMGPVLPRMARPGVDEDTVWSGHKRAHGLKFQSLMAPCGLVLDLAGAYPGGRNDAILLRWAGLEEELEAINAEEEEDEFVLYGDSAYSAARYVLTAYGGGATPAQLRWNTEMNAVRTSVEWGFAKIVQHCAYFQCPTQLRLRQQPLGHMYATAVLITNIHSLLYGGGTTQAFFACDMPFSLEWYLDV